MKEKILALIEAELALEDEHFPATQLLEELRSMPEEDVVTLTGHGDM